MSLTMRTLLKSSNAMRPSPRSHAPNVVEGVRQCKTAVDRGERREFECYWNLLMLDFWYRTVPHAPMMLRRLWTAFECRRPLMAFECMRRRQWECCIKSWTVDRYVRQSVLGPYIVSYRIAIFCTVLYRIHRFPHGHIVPSLVRSLNATVQYLAQSSWLVAIFRYHIYSRISRPAYKPTPIPTAENLAIISDPHISR